jgi:hypothetical protein
MTVNAENCRRVALAIETHAVRGLGFSMLEFFVSVTDCRASVKQKADWLAQGCGTVACIGGWTVAACEGMSGVDELAEVAGGLADRASRHLGLDAGQERALFYLAGEGAPGFEDVTPVDGRRSAAAPG